MDWRFEHEVLVQATQARHLGHAASPHPMAEGVLQGAGTAPEGGEAMSKDLWILEHETALEEFRDGWLDETGLRQRLKALGFDTHEIGEQIAEEMENWDDD